jgi:hypothetical protein
MGHLSRDAVVQTCNAEDHGTRGGLVQQAGTATSPPSTDLMRPTEANYLH